MIEMITVILVKVSVISLLITTTSIKKIGTAISNPGNRVVFVRYRSLASWFWGPGLGASSHYPDSMKPTGNLLSKTFSHSTRESLNGWVVCGGILSNISDKLQVHP